MQPRAHACSCGVGAGAGAGGQRQRGERKLEHGHRPAAAVSEREAAAVLGRDPSDDREPAWRPAIGPSSRRGAGRELSPESSTATRTPRSHTDAAIRTGGDPCSIALTTRLSRACAIRRGSATIAAAPARHSSDSDPASSPEAAAQRSAQASTSGRRRTSRRCPAGGLPSRTRSRSPSAQIASSSGAGRSPLRPRAAPAPSASSCRGRRSSCRARPIAALRRPAWARAASRSPAAASAAAQPSAARPATALTARSGGSRPPSS